MSTLNEYLATLRNEMTDTTETAETTNLHLSKEQFKEKLLKEESGSNLLDRLERGESRVVERMKLCHGYRDDDGQIWFDVPQWKNLVVHLQIVDKVLREQEIEDGYNDSHSH